MCIELEHTHIICVRNATNVVFVLLCGAICKKCVIICPSQSYIYYMNMDKTDVHDLKWLCDIYTKDLMHGNDCKCFFSLSAKDNKRSTKNAAVGFMVSEGLPVRLSTTERTLGCK